MKTLRSITTCLACVCLLGTLASCVQWNIGGRIEDSFTSYHSVDTRVPVGGKVYRLEKNGETTWYMQAPVITCRPEHYLVTPPDLDGSYPERTFISHVRYTGTTSWVKVHPCHTGMKTRDCPGGIPTLDSFWEVDEYVGSLPEGARLWSDTETHSTDADIPAPKPMRHKGDAVMGSIRKFPGQVFGAPFRYAIDPALTVVSTVPVGVFHLFGGLLAVDMYQNQQTPDRGGFPEVDAAEGCISAVRRGSGYTFLVEDQGPASTIHPAADLPRFVPTGKPITVRIVIRKGDTPPTEAERRGITTSLQRQGYRHITLIDTFCPAVL